MTTTLLRRGRRAGFTLVELLVAIGLAVLLLSIAAAVSSTGTFNSYKVTNGSDRLSGWLLIAKARAARDQAPRGLRLIVDTIGGMPVVKECVYVEAPQAWVPDPVQGQNPQIAPRLVIQRVPGPPTAPNDSAPPPDGLPVRYQTRIFVLNAPDLTSTVNVGDLLVVPEIGAVHQVIAFNRADFPTAPVDPRFLEDPQVAGSGRVPPGGRSQNSTNPAPRFGNDFAALGYGPITSVVEINLLTIPDLGLAMSRQLNGTPLGTPTYPLQPAFQTFKFGFYRQPRPLAGEPTLQLPVDVVVDLTQDGPANTYPRTRQTSRPPTLIGNNLDILFAPSGQVLFNSQGQINLWVRDLTNGSSPPLIEISPPVAGQNYGPLNTTVISEAGDNVLVTVYTRTGSIATHPVYWPNPTNGQYMNPENPYKFAQDGFNSGL